MIPPHAIPCWIEGDKLYAAIPHKDPSKPPVYFTFSITEGGLTKALSILKTKAKPAAPRTDTVRPMTREDHRSVMALNILKSRGILRR